MFLNGHLTDSPPVPIASIPPPGAAHARSIDVKDRLNRFTVMPENIWNNPYRTSTKTHKFFHAKDQSFKCKFPIIYIL